MSDEGLMMGKGDESDVESGRCCPTCRHPLTAHNVAVWNAGYAVSRRHSEEEFAERERRAVVEALQEAASDLLEQSRALRAAYHEHNAGRDLSTKRPRRPDLDTWANATEANAHSLRLAASIRSMRPGVALVKKV